MTYISEFFVSAQFVIPYMPFRPDQHAHVLSSLMNLILLLQLGGPLGILEELWTEWFLR